MTSTNISSPSVRHHGGLDSDTLLGRQQAQHLINHFNNEFLLRPTMLLAPSLTGHSSFRSSWLDPSLCLIWFSAFLAGKNILNAAQLVGF